MADLIIERCPCGAEPQNLMVLADYNIPKWAYACCPVCQLWSVEFRNSHHPIASPESQQLAIEAWNALPRGGMSHHPLQNDDNACCWEKPQAD